jgi:hypothetical protein
VQNYEKWNRFEYKEVERKENTENDKDEITLAEKEFRNCLEKLMTIINPNINSPSSHVDASLQDVARGIFLIDVILEFLALDIEMRY